MDLMLVHGVRGLLPTWGTSRWPLLLVVLGVYAGAVHLPGRQIVGLEHQSDCDQRLKGSRSNRLEKVWSLE